MGSKVEYVETSQMYATDYVRNSKAIGVLWGIFTICYAIISVVSFVTPEWMGDTWNSENPARFGLWKVCQFSTSASATAQVTETCDGNLFDFSSIISVPFKIATGFSALSILIAVITIVALILFFFCTSTTVFKVCGWLQVISGICQTGTIITYPMGWGASVVMKTCGSNAGVFSIGDCSIRWAYILAIISALDVFILATLAFILAARHLKLQPEPSPNYITNGSLYKGEVNNGYMNDGHSMTGSRKSLNMQPVLLMPQPSDMDRFSEFSNRTGRSKTSAYRAEYASSMQNFQL